MSLETFEIFVGNIGVLAGIIIIIGLRKIFSLFFQDCWGYMSILLC
jgi:hypothetical protein